MAYTYGAGISIYKEISFVREMLAN